MAVKPILFNTEMVKAILEGRKTVTRRLIKPQPSEQLAYIWGGSNHGKWCYSPYDEKRYDEHRKANDWKYWTPPYHADDILYVRETWAEMPYGYVYRADCEECEEPESWDCDDRWRPSIHMSKEAARIWLRVTDVRVERLQDMTEDDVVAEGAEPLIQCPIEHRVWDASGALIGMCWNEDLCSGGCDFITKSYGELFGEIVWDSTIKPADRDRYGWAANPWVWVINFERCDKPEGNADL